MLRPSALRLDIGHYAPRPLLADQMADITTWLRPKAVLFVEEGKFTVQGAIEGRRILGRILLTPHQE